MTNVSWIRLEIDMFDNKNPAYQKTSRGEQHRSNLDDAPDDGRAL